MPETRVIQTIYGLGGYDSSKPNNNIVEQVTKVISDAELVDEAETKALAKVDELIDAITNLAEAKLFLKRLVARLIKKGMLP